jgi:hypothetical protein
MEYFGSKKKLKILFILIVLLITSITFFSLYFHIHTDSEVEFKAPNFSTSSVVLSVVGDCNGYNIVEYQGKSLDPLASVRTLINQSNIFLFNMEGVILFPQHLGCSTKYEGQSCFVSPPSFASYMKAENETVANLANNHVLDGGKTGVEDTRKALEESGIQYLGAGNNASEACHPLILTVKGTKIGFLSYNLYNELLFSANKYTPGAASFIACNATDSIRHLRERADIVVVVLHWGNAWDSKITASQIVIADRLSDAGADLIIGSHPHVLQGIGMYNNTLTFFSLGNFIIRPDYNMPSNAHNSVIAFIEIYKGKVRHCYLYPMRLDDQGIPRIPTKDNADFILFNLTNMSGDFNNRIEKDKQVGVINIS